MNIIKGLKKIKEQIIYNQTHIDLSAINLYEGQQYVMDLDTEERITAFNCFPARQLGQSTAVVLKAIQLSNKDNKKIIICSYDRMGNAYKRDLFLDLLSRYNQSEKAVLVNGNTSNTIYELCNGSTITFQNRDNQATMRGQRADYILVDDVDFQDQSFLDEITYSILRSEKGQAFFFPKIR